MTVRHPSVSCGGRFSVTMLRQKALGGVGSCLTRCHHHQNRRHDACECRVISAHRDHDLIYISLTAGWRWAPDGLRRRTRGATPSWVPSAATRWPSTPTRTEHENENETNRRGISVTASVLIVDKNAYSPGGCVGGSTRLTHPWIIAPPSSAGALIQTSSQPPAAAAAGGSAPAAPPHHRIIMIR
jgi:hypothetical protein